MLISIQKNSPLSIREQIKRQIRLLIENNTIKPGQALPSARDLSAILRINRNTVTQAYKELSTDGILEIVIGSGTFVKEELMLKTKTPLDQAFDRALRSARQCGFGTKEIVDHFFNRLSALSNDHSRKRVLVVDCNDETIGYLCHLISSELGVHTQGVLIDEIEKNPQGMMPLFEGRDLVVCGFNHLEELNQAVPNLSVEVVAVLLQVDAKVINDLAQLPQNMTVGFVCANQRSTETLYNSSYFSGGKELKRILAGYDNSQKLEKLVRECDVIFASNFVYPRMEKMVKPHQKLINVQISVDSSSIDLIRERLSEGSTL
jgi:DNA-binding transcriptional regulator YhcF (GntR family)